MRSTYLEEALQPPNLEHALSDQNAELEDTPPLDPRIGALGCVSVRPLPNNNVALLVLNLGYEFGHLAHCEDVSALHHPLSTRESSWLALTLPLQRVVRCF